MCTGAGKPPLTEPLSGSTAPVIPGAEAGAASDATTLSPQAAWKWEESDDSVVSYGVLAALLALGTLPSVQSEKLADLPYFIGLAVTTIYIGAHRSLTTTQRQQLSIKEGALAPVLASVSLFACYCLVKYLPDFNFQVCSPLSVYSPHHAHIVIWLASSISLLVIPCVEDIPEWLLLAPWKLCGGGCHRPAAPEALRTSGGEEPDRGRARGPAAGQYRQQRQEGRDRPVRHYRGAA